MLVLKNERIKNMNKNAIFIVLKKKDIIKKILGLTILSFMVIFIFGTIPIHAQERNKDDEAALSEIVTQQKSARKLEQQVKWNNSGRITEIKWIDNNNLEGTLDLSRLTELESVEIEGFGLTGLKVNGLQKLKKLRCSNSNLTQLDVSELINLEILDCCAIPIKTLKLGKLTKLKELYCIGNKLTKLDVSQLTNLESFIFAENKVKLINIDNNKKIKYLDCSYNSLRNLNITKLPHLVMLNCQGNEINVLNIGKSKKLKFLNCELNKLKKLDISKLTSLSSLQCSFNQLKILNIKKNKKLKRIEVAANKISKLDVRGTMSTLKMNCDKKVIVKSKKSQRIKRVAIVMNKIKKNLTVRIKQGEKIAISKALVLYVMVYDFITIEGSSVEYSTAQDDIRDYSRLISSVKKGKSIVTIYGFNKHAKKFFRMRFNVIVE